MTVKWQVRLGIGLLWAIPCLVPWPAFVLAAYQGDGTNEALSRVLGLAIIVVPAVGPALAGAWWRVAGAVGASIGGMVGVFASDYVYQAIAPLFPGRPQDSYDLAWASLGWGVALIAAPVAGLAGWFTGVFVRGVRATKTAELSGPWNAPTR